MTQFPESCHIDNKINNSNTTAEGTIPQKLKTKLIYEIIYSLCNLLIQLSIKSYHIINKFNYVQMCVH